MRSPGPMAAPDPAAAAAAAAAAVAAWRRLPVRNLWCLLPVAARSTLGGEPRWLCQLQPR